METNFKKLLDRIRADSLHEAKTIIEDAKNKIKQSIEESVKKGREDALRQKDAILRDARSKATTLRNRIISKAKLRASTIRLEAVNKALDDIFKLTLEELIEWSQTDKDGYKKLLEKLIMEGAVVVEASAEIFVKNNDRSLGLDLNSLSKKIKDSFGVEVKLRYCNEPLKASGGVIVRSLDGRVVVDNTFKALIDRFKKKLYRHALELLLKD